MQEYAQERYTGVWQSKECHNMNIKTIKSLRGVCSHVGALVLPGAISISGIQNVFDENGQCTDEGTQKSITKCGSNLIDYLLKYTCPDNSLESSVRKLN